MGALNLLHLRNRLKPLFLAPCAFLAASAALATVEPDAVSEAIRSRVEALAAGQAVEAGAEPLRARVALPTVYAQRGFAPLWIDDETARTELVEAIEGASLQGLEADHYHAELLAEALTDLARGGGRRVEDPDRIADIELALTDAFLLFGAHLVSGRVNPESFDPEWIAVRREVDLTQALARAEGAGVARVLRELEPEAPGYRRLVDALARYRRLAAEGGWAAVGEGDLLALEERSEGDRVERLRRRLVATGELDPRQPSPEPSAFDDTSDQTFDDTSDQTFDEALDLAVKAFQRRHGLEPDGKVGRQTVTELDVPVGDRIAQIERNLERWRWLPQSLGEHHLRVNVPDYSLEEWRSGEKVLEMRVVVGRSYRRTPVFSGEISYLVLNPSWEVPPSLAARDKLPLIREDVTYLERLGFDLLQGWGGDESRVDPATVDWGAVTPKAFPYRLRQRPGPLNALGRVKFMFPNRFNVYLHDTPERGLFARNQRDFSSGCIRLERPLELAGRLLAGLEGWPAERIDRVVASGVTETVVLPEPVPVHLLYFTAWANEDGSVHFRRDLYGRDASLARALAAPPPG